MAGRPKKYTLEFCTEEVRDMLCLIEDDEEKKITTLQDLIRHRPYSRQRISEWRETFKEDRVFSDTLKKIEDELEDRLFKMGLSGKGNSTMAIFGLKNNFGWKDKTEQDVNLEGITVILQKREGSN